MKGTAVYRLIRGIVKAVYPKMEVVGTENLPDEPCVVVGNHTQMNGPIAAELYFPGERAIWCAGQMMNWDEVADYAFEDFWSFKPKRVQWFYRILSKLIVPLSVCVFNNAHTIPVYRDTRIISTFRLSIARLKEGANIIIYPEHNQKRNNIVYDFQDKFIDLARFYYKQTGEELSFVPMYIAPALKKMYLGTPIRFHADAPIGEERRRICDELMDSIARIACSLPLHTVVPYRNIGRRNYPKNLPFEVYDNEKTGG